MNHFDANIQNLTQVSERHIEELCDLLVDCVEGGASVGFMLPFSRERALTFWQRVAEAVKRGERALLVSEDERGIRGTVQLNLALPENQPHRADVAKMLVHRRARRQGVGAALMRAAEAAALAQGRNLRVLDTVTESVAARLYERLGWIRVGEIPEYALWPGGGHVGTTVYSRKLGG